MAFKPEVHVEGKWCQNGLAYATEAEAFASACALMDRWFAVTDARAVEVEGLPATHVWRDGKTESLPVDPGPA